MESFTHRIISRQCTGCFTCSTSYGFFFRCTKTD